MKLAIFIKALPNVKSANATLKEFTPKLQIFYIFLIVFGLNVQVPGLELPKWNIFLEFGLNVQVSGVKLPQ